MMRNIASCHFTNRTFQIPADVQLHPISPTAGLGFRRWKALNLCTYGSHYVRWVTCQHGMARPQVQDGRDDIHIRRAAVNILN
jgi:hypothetical protein